MPGHAEHVVFMLKAWVLFVAMRTTRALGVPTAREEIWKLCWKASEPGCFPSPMKPACCPVMAKARSPTGEQPLL